MSVNWVMLSTNGDFERLPNENLLFTTPPRVSISLDSVNKFPGRQPYHLSCSAGKAYLTNRRIIYLPTTPPPRSTSTNPSPLVLYSFSAPVLNIHDSHVTAPWFGPNVWQCIAQPVPGGGLPSGDGGVELSLTFKEGGAYDWHARLIEVRERTAQMRELYGVAQDVGRGAPGIHLEQLPAYAPIDHPFAPPSEESVQNGTSNQQASRTDGAPTEQPMPGLPTAQQTQMSGTRPAQNIPLEPPPAYED